MNRHATKLVGKKYAIIGLIVVLLTLIWWFVTHSFLTIGINPVNSIVLLDNAPIKINRRGTGRAIIKPGKHTIKVEANGYLSTTNESKFSRASLRKMKISLKSNPEPTLLMDNATLLSAGKNDEVYFLGNQGKLIFKSTLIEDGVKITPNTYPITDSKLSGVNKIIWSPTNDLALFKKKDGVYLFDFKKYDFVNQTETLWGRDVGEIAWSPDNSKIAYYSSPSQNEKLLIFSDLINNQKTVIANLLDLSIENPILRWSPDSQYLLVVPRNFDYSLNNIYLLDAYSKEFAPISDTGQQLDGIFSPDSNKIIYSTYSPDPSNATNSLLSIMNKDGSDKKSLDLRTSLSKIVFLNDSEILTTITNPDLNTETIIRYNLDSKTIKGELLNITSSKKIITIAIVNKSTIIYETADGVFAFEADL